MSNNSLDIILRPWAPNGISLPPWISVTSTTNQVGVFFQNESTNGIEHDDIKSPLFYAAGGQSRPSFKIYRDGPTPILEVKGFIIASVKTVMDAAYEGEIPIK